VGLWRKLRQNFLSDGRWIAGSALALGSVCENNVRCSYSQSPNLPITPFASIAMSGVESGFRFLLQPVVAHSSMSMALPLLYACIYYIYAVLCTRWGLLHVKHSRTPMQQSLSSTNIINQLDLCAPTEDKTNQSSPSDIRRQSWGRQAVEWPWRRLWLRFGTPVLSSSIGHYLFFGSP